MGLTTLVKAASVLALIRQVSGACYRPDGVDRNALPWIKDNDYQPCNKGGGHSMCCSTQSFDTCRPNGLCYNEGAKLLWRESCTDPTWKDPACIKLCAGADQLADDGKSMATTDIVITICGDNSLCCGSGSFAQRCCDAKKGFKILSNGTVVEAYPEPKPIVVAPKPTTAAQKNNPAPTPTPIPADPSPNTGSGGGGSSGGGTNNNGGGGGGGSTNNGDGSGSNGGGSGGSGGSGGGGGGSDGGNDNSNDNGNGENGSPDSSTGGSESTPGSNSDGADGTKSSEGGTSSSSPKDSQTDDNNDTNSDNDGSSAGKENGNKDSKDSASPIGANDTNGSPGGSSSGDNKNGNSNDNSGSGSGSGSDSSGGGGSSGAVIGGVVGGVLGGLVLFAVAAWFVMRRRRARAGYAARRLGSASELPGTDGRTFYEVPGDHKVPAVPVVEQVVYRDKPREPHTFYEMEARSPVLAVPTRYA
ncbi:hypothetical protein V8F06_005587 [Rhypophila decipiens]